jgi:UDP-N-acetylmuramoylalanine--D-glutamate ligase
MDLRGQTALVMGLGVHGGGLGVARWLLRQGARVTVTDMADAQALAEPLAALRAAEAETGNAASYVLGEHRAEDFERNAVVVANQAVRPDSPWVARARAAGAAVETELTLFFHRCPGPILGVTGTKGKTTTTLLLGAMLRQQWPDTVLAGNLRVSALEALDRITPDTPVALELSSFQLEWLGQARISPPYALVTNLSPDHLNRHGTMEAYADAKAQIFRWQGPEGVAVLNGDDALSRQYFADVSGRTIWVSRGDPLPFVLADLQLDGEHNIMNARLAAALAGAFGAGDAAIGVGLRSLRSVEHRQELVATVGGVRYINDTTATNPAAALVALESVKGPIVLIAGGADKQLDFAELGPRIARRAKALVLLAGSATERLAQAVRENGDTLPILGPFDDLAAAVDAARGAAAPGDAILLSPGCASFGMFRNEFHRGDEFRRIVNALNP